MKAKTNEIEAKMNEGKYTEESLKASKLEDSLNSSRKKYFSVENKLLTVTMRHELNQSDTNSLSVLQFKSINCLQIFSLCAKGFSFFQFARLNKFNKYKFTRFKYSFFYLFYFKTYFN